MQFTLRTLQVIFIYAAAALGLGGVWGLVGAAYLLYLVTAGRVALASERTRTLNNCAAVLSLTIAMVLVLAYLGYLGVNKAVSGARQASCNCNLKQLGLVLHIYHDQYGQFPPPYVVDAQGRPMHSWRVLILPEIGETALYKAYRLDEPWDSPYNRKVAARTPLLFRCPANKNPIPGTTDYVAVTGPGTMWPDSRGCGIRDIKDGTSNTLMLIEASGSDIPWNAPRDLTLDKVLAADPTEAITSHHDRRAPDLARPLGNVAFADGSVDYIDGRLTAADFKALATIAGGEEVNLEKIRAVMPNPPLLAPTSLSVVLAWMTGWIILVTSFIYLICRPLPERWIGSSGQSEAGETDEADQGEEQI
ncbi:MAG: DUF1559 domain-containing protein [Pirellulales bacterium]|nr:DUF1559 domain-containing protein [Pirellulales bacterium]